MAVFQMPKLSDTMEEGTILRWLAAEGDELVPGQPLAEIETDKATMTVESPAAGALHLMAAEGDVLPVGASIAAIGEGVPPADSPSGDDEQANIPVGDDGTTPTIGAEVDLTETYPAALTENIDTPAPKGPAPTADAGAVAPPPEAARVKASPLARRLASEHDIDIARVRGSGPDGRVVRADVEAAAAGEPTALRPAPTASDAEAVVVAPVATPAPSSPQPTVAPRPVAGERTPLSRLRRTVAKRMIESTRDAPHFYLERDVDTTDAIALRRELVEASADHGPSLNDLIVRAVALAAAADLDALRRYAGDALEAADGVHVGIAVTVPQGLLVPVVRDADRKTVGQIATETRALVARARTGTLAPAEIEGSTISVSNLGMFGIDRFSAVLNPPEPAMLAVGRAAPAAVVRDGQIVARDVMTLTLSVDHRALYGAEGAQLLGRIAELLEHPHALVL